MCVLAARFITARSPGCGRRRWSRWRGKPDPGPVDLTRMLPVAYGVSVILIGLSVLVIYADLFKPITLGG